jgi:hypothetical protein
MDFFQPTLNNKRIPTIEKLDGIKAGNLGMKPDFSDKMNDFHGNKPCSGLRWERLCQKTGNSEPVARFSEFFSVY